MTDPQMVWPPGSALWSAWLVVTPSALTRAGCDGSSFQISLYPMGRGVTSASLAKPPFQRVFWLKPMLASKSASIVNLYSGFLSWSVFAPHAAAPRAKKGRTAPKDPSRFMGFPRMSSGEVPYHDRAEARAGMGSGLSVLYASTRKILRPHF